VTSITNGAPLALDTIPIDTAIRLVLDRIPSTVEFGDGEGGAYPGIRGGVAEALRGWRGSRAWRSRIAATAFRG
jgi:hypothetical protein